MTRSARSAGGLPIVSGRKPLHEPPISRQEAKEFARTLREHTAPNAPSTRPVRHFSQFDEALARLAIPTADEATQRAVVLLGECATADWRGVRPQLASLLTLIGRMARRDGYSLRVVAQTASHTL